jgi:hypothetical protein
MADVAVPRRHIVGLAILAVVAVLVTEAPLVHAHTDVAPGWYDEECPLSRLSAGPPSLPGFGPATLAWFPFVDTGPRLAEGAALPRLTPLDCEARAPPTAS